MSFFDFLLFFHSFCQMKSLDPTLIKGKIVVCRLETIASDRRGLLKYIRDTEAVGLILIDSLVKDVIFQSGIQATLVGEDGGKDLEEYIAAERYVYIYIYISLKKIIFVGLKMTNLL